ncbi:MAG: hypothetical protein QOF30_3281 [Acidimicrobiaceae bacterium]|nr:hypothetical protein [Acidimicrobiaceae bacterium]
MMPGVVDEERPAVGAKGPVAVLVAMVGAYWLVFGFLVYRQQSNFGTFGFDIGIHDQGIWLASQGRPTFVTVRGLDYFAHHVNLISMAFVPFYWLGAGPHLLIVVHTLVVACGAIPLWLLARDRLENAWLALAPPLAYLLYPATNWVTWWAYHPDSLAITPLLFAYWLAVRGKWRWFAFAVVVALSCKEDTALSVLMLGLVVALWLRPLQADDRADGRVRRWIGWSTAVAGLGWYLVCTKVIIPWRNGGRPPFYDAFFPSLGASIPDVIYNAIRHPSRVWHLAQLPDRRTYYVQMFLPLAFLPILAVPIFLIGGPQFGVDVTAQYVQGATIKSQYASLVIVGSFLATVEALAFLRRRLGQPALLVGVAALSLMSVVGAVTWGLSPIGTQFHHHGVWLAHNRLGAELHTALSMVPARDGVSVTYYLTPQMTHRQYVYEFPNPWQSVNYGINNDRGDPATVQWLVLDAATLGQPEQALFAQLTSPSGSFRIVYNSHGVMVAHRAAP